MAASANGWSPWTLTTTSASGRRSATSATRSVPLGWSARVISTTPPKPSTQAAIRSSSVATTTASKCGQLEAAS